MEKDYSGLLSESLSNSRIEEILTHSIEPNISNVGLTVLFSDGDYYDNEYQSSES